MGVLIAYYSRADENYFGGTMKYIQVGNTEKAAKMIAEKTGGKLLKIEQMIPYAADYATCIAQAKEDLKKNVRPELTGMPESLDDVDEIYLGYPIYWGKVPVAVSAFLEKYDFSGKKIHPFCTHEGSGLCSTKQDIENTAKGATVCEGLALLGSTVDSAKEEVHAWVNASERG